MLLTPGMAEDAGRIGYVGAVRTCRPCGGQVWATEFGSHTASHEEAGAYEVWKPGQDGPTLHYG